ncbi:MAG: HAMP domain-containing sensor histidine kinase, partial [Candidatus Dormiibacterota bacterium]
MTGDRVSQALQLVVAAAFLLIGLLALRDWWRGGERRQGYLALALGSLGLVALAGGLESLFGNQPRLDGLLLVLFMLSAAGLLLYRDSVLRLPTAVRMLAAILLVGPTAFILVVGIPASANPAATTPIRSAALDVLLAVWCLAIAEPAYRLFRVSGGLPLIQRARMRSLAAGYAGIMVVVVLILVAFMAGVDNRVGVALQTCALLCVPPLYVGFAPPRWLRARWRRPVEDRLRRATHDLLLYSPDRATLASRGLDWAIRLVGGASGLIADAGGELLATQGLSEAEAREILERPELRLPEHLVRIGKGGRTAVVHRLSVSSGTGHLVVLAGSLSPTIDAEAAGWLTGYAAALSIALDRVRVSELLAQTADELRAARDMAEAASRAKSEFLSRVSHELRTPLTSMIGFAELLLGHQLDAEQERHVRTILRAGDHLLGLVNEMLDISRIEDGRIALTSEPVSVHQVVAEVLDLTRPMAGELNTRVRVPRIPGSLRVTADRQRLTQVMLNLVTNAIKYNRREGWVEIRATTSEGRCRVCVRDGGVGLRPEEVERLFTPFERLSAAASAVEGTGLGLALSKSLVEAMSGSIGVESVLGRGSTFWVELPEAAPAPPAVAGDGGPGLSLV